jgi:hypothetical protein
MQPLTFAYWANIAILAPIAAPTVFRLFPTDQPGFAESGGWRVLVGAPWSAILILSVLGLFHPFRYSPVLLLQSIYKCVWLGVYAGPRALRGEWRSIPWGITGAFLVIAALWPFVIRWSYLFEARQ